TWSTTYVPEVCISHFSRPVNDTPHDGNPYTLKVGGCSLNARCYLLEIKKSASTRRESHIVCLKYPCSRCLENIIGKPYGLFMFLFSLNKNSIANTITNQGTHMYGRLQEGGERIMFNQSRQKCVL